MFTSNRWTRRACGALLVVLTTGFAGHVAPAGAESADHKAPAQRPPAPSAEECSLRAHAAKSPRDGSLKCITALADLSKAPALGETAVLKVKVTSQHRRDRVEVAIDLPENLELVERPSGAAASRALSRDGTGPVTRAAIRQDFGAGQARTYTAKVKAVRPGDAQIRVRATASLAGGRADAGADDVFVTVGEQGRPSKFGIDVPALIGAVPRPDLAAPDAGPASEPAKVLPPDPAPISGQDSEDASAPADASLGPGPSGAPAAGTSCLTGTWNYVDQTAASRASRGFKVEAWDRDSSSGDDFLGAVYTDTAGRFTLCFANNDEEGSTQEVWAKFVAANGAWRMEPVLEFGTAIVNPADATTHNFGNLYPSNVAYNRGLHAYDEAYDAWLWTPGTTCWDPNDTSCRQLLIRWSPSSTDGTYWDGTVHLKADDPNTPFAVVHAIAQNSMYDLFDGFYPQTPNCVPHWVFTPSSAGCAWVQGWAHWFAASVYNDPSYRSPDGGVVPLEKPSWGAATAGDTVEGWVAAALIDIADTSNEGPWDRYSEFGLASPGNIFAEMANDGLHPDTFRTFWNRRAALGYNTAATGALASIYQSTIDYGFRDPLSNYVELTRPTPVPDNYSFNTTSAYWSAVAVRPPAGVDYDLWLFDDRAQTTLLASSAADGGVIDFVAVNSNTGRRPLGDYFPRVTRYGGSGNYQVELAQGSNALSQGSQAITLSSTDVIAVRDTLMTAGRRKHIRVVPRNGQDAELFLMASDAASPTTWVRPRGLAVAAGSAAAAGGAETIAYTPTADQWAGLVLINKAGSGTYDLYVDESAPTGSVVINSGASVTKSTSVTLTLSATDAETGIDAVQVSVDGALDSEPFVSYGSSSRLTTLPSGDGTKTVLVRYRNRAGMVSPAFSDTIVLDSRPDLETTAVGNPPTSAVRGQAFTISDTVKNTGATASGASVSTFYLSVDTSADRGDVRLGGRDVPGLAPGATSSATTSVQVPATTAAGQYHVIACADHTSLVAEPFENNNCRASATKVTVQVPDLVISTISNPPASAARGSSFSITSATLNNSTAPVTTWTTTTFYLSADTLKGNDVGAVNRSVEPLAGGASSSGAITMAVASTTPVGSYHVLACADEGNKVAETSETNNCRASTSKVNVT